MSAPMVGKSEKGLTEQEKTWLAPYQAWCDGLGELGLKNERRMLRLIPQDLSVETLHVLIAWSATTFWRFPCDVL